MKSFLCVAVIAALCGCLYLPAAEALTCWVGSPGSLTQQTCSGPACKVYGSSTAIYYASCGENGISASTTQCTLVAGWQTNPSPCYCSNNLCNPAARSVPVSISAVVAIAVATSFAAMKWH